MQEIMAKQAMHEMQLKQLGAKIVSYHGLQCFVKFDLSGIEVSYSYNLNTKNQFFLQRIKPYSMVIGVYEEIDHVVDTIKADLERFKNSSSVGHFDKFLEVNTRLLEAVKDLENLFLDSDVDEKAFDELTLLLTNFENKIKMHKDK